MCPVQIPISWSNAERYEQYSGRWSRHVARDFLQWLAVPPGSRWIEPGCGTGALTSQIVALASPAVVVASDPSEPYLAFARETVDGPVVSFVSGRAETLDAVDDSVDATVSALVLNFVADPAASLAEARRVTRSGGVVAGYIWDYSGGVQAIRHFWDVAILLDPVARRLHEGRRFVAWMPEDIARRFRKAGLTDVVVEPIVIDMVYEDFEEYWDPMLGGQGTAPTYIASLEPASVAMLREAVRTSLPIAPDGSIRMTARAWAVRSIVPDR